MKDHPFGIPETELEKPAQRSPLSFDQAINPYAATSAVSDTEGFESDAETFRRNYLSHEASVQAIGLLYMIPGALFLVFSLVFSVMFIGSLVTGPTQGLDRIPIGTFGLFSFYIVAGILQCMLGYHLRRFSNLARGIVTAFSVIGLIGVPFGTLISIYVLWLLHGQKGKVVFSDEYQQVIAQTPHIKYKTSPLVTILGLLLLAMMAISFLSIFLIG